MFFEQNEKHTQTQPYELQITKKITINYNLIVRYTYYLAVGITLHLNDK